MKVKDLSHLSLKIVESNLFLLSYNVSTDSLKHDSIKRSVTQIVVLVMLI